MNVAVIGASADRSKFGNKAVRAYVKCGHTVFPVNLRAAEIENLRSYSSVLEIPVELDSVLIYLQPEETVRILEEIARKGTHELILNPGTESATALQRSQELDLPVKQTCAIVAIGENPSDYP